MSARAITRAGLALAVGLVLAGCTSEHEVSEGEMESLLGSGAPFEVDGKPFSGRVVYREGDKLKFKADFKKGRPNGTLEAFHDNGELASRTEVIWDEDKKDAIVDGEDTRWNEEGIKVRRKIAKRGQDQSLERWCDDGDREEVVKFEDGERSKREAWDCDTGQQVAAETYDDEGRFHGEQKAWVADGTLVAHRILSSGEPDGLQQEWHPNGQARLRATFVAGVPTGSLERWDDVGKLVEAGDYRDGEKTGLWLEGHGEPRQVHYGPDGFVRPELASGFVRALTSRPDPKAVEFWLKEGQVKIGDALPASYNGNPAEGTFSFPVQDWTYPVVVADPSLLAMLVEQGADINQADSQRSTRLLRCASKFSGARANYGGPCRPDELQQIVSLGGRADAVDLKGRNALHRLLDISSSDDRDWGRPHAASREARTAAIGQLVKAGADPNAADAEGYTPLVHALKARRSDLVRALLASEARADTGGPNGSKAVHWLFLNAVDSYQIDEGFVQEMLPLLVAAGADPKATMVWNDEPVTLRDLAARHALVDVVQALDGA